MSYFPLDRELLTSSMWSDASPAALKVWFYLLLSANPRDGIVRDTVPAMAQRCGLTVDEVEEILNWLEQPDSYSRTLDHDGRRIERGLDGIRLITYIKHRDRDYSTARVRKFRARQKAREAEPERNGVKRRSTVTETTDTDTDTEIKSSSSNPKTEPQKAELRSESNSAHGSKPSSSRKNGAEETARSYVAVLDAVTGRKTRTLAPDVVKRVGQRLRDWRPWQIVGVPILVYAQGRHDRYSPDVFLRDGSNPRTRNGNSYGAYYWLARTYEQADGTHLDSRLTSIAEQAGILDQLRTLGVITEATA